MVDSDAPKLEASLVHLKETIAHELGKFKLVGMAVEAINLKKQNEDRQRALAALGEAALAAASTDQKLAVGLLKLTRASQREQVRALLPTQTDDSRPQKHTAKKAVKVPTATPADFSSMETWTAKDFRRYIVKLKPRNRTHLRELNSAAFRIVQKQHPDLLEELLPRQRTRR